MANERINMKFLRVTMENGEVWDIDLTHIAINRAKYYAGHDNPDETADKYHSEWQQTYNEEFNFTMANEDFAIDWASNNMNWEDVEPYAKKISIESKDFDYQAGWIKGDIKVISKEN